MIFGVFNIAVGIFVTACTETSESDRQLQSLEWKGFMDCYDELTAEMNQNQERYHIMQGSAGNCHLCRRKPRARFLTGVLRRLSRFQQRLRSAHMNLCCVDWSWVCALLLLLVLLLLLLLLPSVSLACQVFRLACLATACSFVSN